MWGQGHPDPAEANLRASDSKMPNLKALLSFIRAPSSQVGEP